MESFIAMLERNCDWLPEAIESLTYCLSPKSEKHKVIMKVVDFIKRLDRD